MKITRTLIASLALVAAAIPAAAQDDLLAEKTVSTLGQPKVWYYYEGDVKTDQSETFDASSLTLLTQVPANTANVFLYPEKGNLSGIAANQTIGAQGFYVDMGASQEVGTVNTTWEGAAADAYSIWLTDNVPTEAILAQSPTYTISGLGQYTAHTAVLPSGARGRYLVFQVTNATNWGWGVKIRSISATAPSEDVLTTFTVTPSILTGNNIETPVTLTLLNQFGIALSQEDVEINVSENAIFENNTITVTSGNMATLTASLGDNTITRNIYVATAPSVPAAESIKTPIFTNTIVDYNSSAEFVVDWNGGASNGGTLTFPNGEVAQLFTSARCIFFSNSETTGAWNANIDPLAKGYRNLSLDVFSAKDVECTIEFESVENLEGGHTYTFQLKEGEWNPISVNVAGATKLGNLSIRFTEANIDDILLANIYFTPAYVEGDEEAPVLGDILYTPSMTSVDLTLTATDDKNPEIYYSISDGTRTFSVSGNSGEAVEYTVSGLNPSTDYEITVTASDGLNVSAPKTISFKTTGLPDAPVPTTPSDQVVAVFSPTYGATETPLFDSWGSQAQFSVTNTENGNPALMFSNYMGQWGGLVNLSVNVENAPILHVDIYANETEADAAPGTITIAPVWDGASNTPNKKLELEGGKWNSFDIQLTEFGYPEYGFTISQISLTESTVETFLIGNLYFYGTTSGIEEVETASGEAVYYTLQGVKVANPEHGIFIKVTNGKAQKVVR